MPFTFHKPSTPTLPILLSVPHAGTRIPPDLRARYRTEIMTYMDDTDWFVDRLYQFVIPLGIPMIVADYSRWVIDLNRAQDSSALYHDKRVITALCPTTDFNGGSIYRSSLPDVPEIEDRTQKYYLPYYQKIESTLQQMRKDHSHVLLFDAHSIRDIVPGIRSDPFPHLILGDVDEHSAHPGLVRTALEALRSSDLELQHNTPFKGGNITRTFGRPAEGIHALQLEMSKTCYMNARQTRWEPANAHQTEQTLKTLFNNLIHTLQSLNT